MGIFCLRLCSSKRRRSGGVPRLRYAERCDQIEWRPVSLDGLLADDHRVHLVWHFVERLDLTALHTFQGRRTPLQSSARSAN